MVLSPDACSLLFVCLFVLSVLKFELRALHLLGRCSIPLATPPAPFDLFFGVFA
jgi:hypothetical protein